MCDMSITASSSETVGRLAIRLHSAVRQGDVLRFSGGGKAYEVRVTQVVDSDEHGDITRVTPITTTSKCQTPGCSCRDSRIQMS